MTDTGDSLARASEVVDWADGSYRVGNRGTWLDAPQTIDEYNAGLPPDARTVMERICQIVRSVVPNVDQKISYGMPIFVLDGRPLTFVAAWKKHVRLHAVPVVEPLEKQLASYRSGKDTVRFQLNKPVPYELIEDLIPALAQHRPS